MDARGSAGRRSDIRPSADRTTAQSYELVAVQLVVGLSVGDAHVAETYDENALRCRHESPQGG
jgi:hypothetical protein